MTEIRKGNAIVRIHNEENEARVKDATTRFLKKVVAIRKKRRREAECASPMTQ